MDAEKEIAAENTDINTLNLEEDIGHKMHIRVRKDMAKMSEQAQNECESHKVKEKENFPSESAKEVERRNVEEDRANWRR